MYPEKPDNPQLQIESTNVINESTYFTEYLKLLEKSNVPVYRIIYSNSVNILSINLIDVNNGGLKQLSGSINENKSKISQSENSELNV